VTGSLSPGELLALATASRLAADPPRGPVRAVAPVARHGLHVVFEGGPGLRLDTRPGRGALLPFESRPSRVRGGRGAWPALAGLADRLLGGRRLEAVAVSRDPVAVGLWFEGGVVLEWIAAPGGGALLLRREDEVRERLGNPRARPVSAWVPPGPGAPGGDRFVLEGVPGDRPRASLAGRAGLRPAGPGEDGLDPVACGAAWYPLALAAEELEARRRRGLRRLAAETKRTRRALAALDREESAAPDPSDLRRRADALLAAGPSLVRDGEAFRVPDPYEPGKELVVPADPPGAPPHGVADRLYRRAGKAERGRAARARRRLELLERLARLEEIRAALAVADTAEEIDAAGARFRELGLPSPAEEERLGGPARKPGGGGKDLPRVLRSPSGFEVLVGRSARGNDRLTFHLAGPEDWWFHVKDRPGAHVVLRGAGRAEPPGEDLLFAAREAAARSGAPPGERVEVWVARRKHVRKPRGAPPGKVSVRKARTILVEVPSPGNRPSGAGSR